MRRAPRRAVVFDCDGVLVDTQGCWDRAYEELFGRYGKRLDRIQRQSLVGMQFVPLAHTLAAMLGHPAPPEALGQELYRLVETNLGDGIAPLPGAVETVRALAGTRRLAVASNTPGAIVRSYLSSFHLLDAFDAVVGSDEVARPKPDPDVYQTACARLGVAPCHAVAVEDSPTGVAAALAAGMYVVGVPSNPDLELNAHCLVDTLAEPGLWTILGLSTNSVSGASSLRPADRPHRFWPNMS